MGSKFYREGKSPLNSGDLHRLSVIVTSYNKRDFIPKITSSLVDLSLSGAEIVIIDDASTDGSLELLQEIQASIEGTTLIALPCNQGSANARNLGISKSTRDFIFFLDIDDSCDSLAILRIAPLLSNPEIQLICANLRRVPENVLMSMPALTKGEIFPIRTLSGQISSTMGYSRYIYRRSYLTDFGLRFYPNRKEAKDSSFILDDAFWMLLISATHGRMWITDSDLVIYTYFSPSPNSNTWSRYLEQVKMLPLLVTRFLSEFRLNSKLDHSLLTRNTLYWMKSTMTVLNISAIIKSGFIDFKIGGQLKRLLVQELNNWEIFMFYSVILFRGVKNSIQIRVRISKLIDNFRSSKCL